ncbi:MULTISPECIES: AAA family ATPase [unclassified Paenibacillus]|uniref:AAA family ATPase n=1 Tax=unclassified Paenibacillus TaxID=185978 RepID=UPI0009CFE118|nr:MULTISPECIES: AAA family ATPase [unclassified Paenibacillus]SLK16539.1 MoxR-like ATPase [Paenibacillus sp. RU5A]SOC74402.1 MoxR-like ATPase [Paenibacillus sp. RU26A]SOC76553.1 MoxR-like ATPase [Paenibacillus sp. RU5M]
MKRVKYVEIDFNQNYFKQLERIRTRLQSEYYERESLIRCALVSVIAGEHMLLIGPPGTAKSSVLERLFQCFRELNIFKWSMNYDTTPDEILGPYEESLYTKGQLRRKTVGKLPEAHMAILDEILRAKGETLNSLLDVINERTILQMSERVKVPLISLFGATNELHDEEQNHALYDRFLIRIKVGYVIFPDALKDMLTSKHMHEESYDSISLIDLNKLRMNSEFVIIPDEIIDAIVLIRTQLFKARIYPSDRRLKASLKLLKASALLDGRLVVQNRDLQILYYVLWNKPADEDKVTRILSDHLR